MDKRFVVLEVGVTVKKIIVTDLDNTLLRSDKSISEYTISVLKNAGQKGLKLYLLLRGQLKLPQNL